MRTAGSFVAYFRRTPAREKADTLWQFLSAQASGDAVSGYVEHSLANLKERVGTSRNRAEQAILTRPAQPSPWSTVADGTHGNPGDSAALARPERCTQGRRVDYRCRICGVPSARSWVGGAPEQAMLVMMEHVSSTMLKLYSRVRAQVQPDAVAAL